MFIRSLIRALAAQPLPPTANPRRDGGKETKTVSLGADDVNVISRRECHSGIKTEGGSDRRNTANLARRCVWELTPPPPTHPAAKKKKNRRKIQPIRKEQDEAVHMLSIKDAIIHKQLLSKGNTIPSNNA